MSDKSNLPTVLSRITEYLDSGGLWNPELADHAAVRELIRDARAEIDRLQAAARDSDDHYADARNEIDRLRRILAALLEPSDAVVENACLALFGAHNWSHDDPGDVVWRADARQRVITQLCAAVAAAEREVGT